MLPGPFAVCDGIFAVDEQDDVITRGVISMVRLESLIGDGPRATGYESEEGAAWKG